MIKLMKTVPNHRIIKSKYLLNTSLNQKTLKIHLNNQKNNNNLNLPKTHKNQTIKPYLLN